MSENPVSQERTKARLLLAALRTDRDDVATAISFHQTSYARYYQPSWSVTVRQNAALLLFSDDDLDERRKRARRSGEREGLLLQRELRKQRRRPLRPTVLDDDHVHSVNRSRSLAAVAHAASAIVFDLRERFGGVLQPFARGAQERIRINRRGGVVAAEPPHAHDAFAVAARGARTVCRDCDRSERRLRSLQRRQRSRGHRCLRQFEDMPVAVVGERDQPIRVRCEGDRRRGLCPGQPPVPGVIGVE